MEKLAQYKLINCSAHIAAVCTPLQLFNINYFNYIKVFSDGYRILLGNHSVWIKHFFENKFYLKANFSVNPNGWTEDYYLWNALPNDDVLPIAQEAFNIDNGITIIDHYKNYLEFFLFASERGNVVINNFYLNNLQLLRHFIFYFKDKAQIIVKAGKNYLSCTELVGEKCSNLNTSNMDLKKLFYSQTKINKYHLNYKGVDFSLSPQQYQCLKLLGEGLPLKFIADRLGVKAKTCQFYLDNIKDKLDCNNRVELLSFIKSAIKIHR